MRIGLTTLRKSSGFTMLELLMVVIVVGLLASLAIPQYQNFVEKARVAEATNSIGTVKSAAALYMLEKGDFSGISMAGSGIDVDVRTTGADTFWTYNIGAANLTEYTITATRTSKDAPPDRTGKTVTMTYTHPNIIKWGGTHPNAPKS